MNCSHKGSNVPFPKVLERYVNRLSSAFIPALMQIRRRGRFIFATVAGSETSFPTEVISPIAIETAGILNARCVMTPSFKVIRYQRPMATIGEYTAQRSNAL